MEPQVAMRPSAVAELDRLGLPERRQRQQEEEPKPVGTLTPGKESYSLSELAALALINPQYATKRLKRDLDRYRATRDENGRWRIAAAGAELFLADAATARPGRPRVANPRANAKANGGRNCPGCGRAYAPADGLCGYCVAEQQRQARLARGIGASNG